MKNGAILKGGVGSGKSITAVAYFVLRECGGSLKVNGVGDYKPFRNPKDLYIITTVKKRDSLEWEEECAHFALSKERGLSAGGVQVTVDSWYNIANYINVEDAFFIFDEQRLVGAGAWVKAFLKIAAKNRWIILSATPGDNWMDYVGVFLANGFFKNRTEFVKRHVVFSRYGNFPKVERYIETDRLEKMRAYITVDMPYERHTKRHDIFVKVDYDEDKYLTVTKKRWHIFEERPVRDVAELFALMRRVVNGDVSRLGEVMKLMEKHPKLIIFYNFNYEREILRTLKNVFDVPVAEWNGDKHEPIPDSDSWIYLVQYTAGAEGWNCVDTDAMIFYSLNYSYKITEQAKGRIDRLNTSFVDLYYYIFRSTSTIDQMIMKALKAKKNFNEAKFATLWEKTDSTLHTFDP